MKKHKLACRCSFVSSNLQQGFSQSAALEVGLQKAGYDFTLVQRYVKTVKLHLWSSLRNEKNTADVSPSFTVVVFFVYVLTSLKEYLQRKTIIYIHTVSIFSFYSIRNFHKQIQAGIE